MKTKFFAVLLALLPISLISCGYRDFVPNAVYTVAVELVDQQGRNISKIVGDSATVDAFYPDGTAEDLYDPQVSSIVDQDSVYYFRLNVNAGCGVLNRPVLMWKLKCKEVFGDEFRIIESNWTEHGQCTSFEFEGKLYVPKLKNGFWTARVVVNR